MTDLRARLDYITEEAASKSRNLKSEIQSEVQACNEVVKQTRDELQTLILSETNRLLMGTELRNLIKSEIQSDIKARNDEAKKRKFPFFRKFQF